jgi:hypothetical protein
MQFYNAKKYYADKIPEVFCIVKQVSKNQQYRVIVMLKNNSLNEAKALYTFFYTGIIVILC